MKRTITLLILGAAMLTGVTLHAQERYSMFTLSGTLSTQGLGADIKVSPLPEFGIRAGFSILPFNWQTVYSGRTESTDLDLDADFANMHLMFDLHPFKSTDGFVNKLVVTGGAAYWFRNKGVATVSYKGIYNYGDIAIPSEDLGALTGTVQWQKVTPYMGFGFENVFPTHLFNVGFAAGAYYFGKPDASLTGSKMLVSNTSNSQEFQSNMSNYRFLPVLQVNLNFSL